MSTKNLKFSKDHEWVKIEEGKAFIGISDFAQRALGDIVFVELPKAGTKLAANKAFASVESVKAVSEIISPVSGTIVAINEKLEESPELINQDPYGAWVIQLELDNPAELNSLMDEKEYEDFCKTQKV